MKNQGTLQDLIRELHKAGDKKKAAFLNSYFKTGKGGYGEGDIFLGITVPVQRKLALRYTHLSLADVRKLLSSDIHEYRFTALELLVAKYEKANEKERGEIFKFYLASTDCINNWDLVDTSARELVGHYLEKRDRKILYKLARSKDIWERRIAIVATHHFIKLGQYEDTLKISKMLLTDTHDLIHKASGWMLREMGNKSVETLEGFLNTHHKVMPRTMLRYALEKFSPEKRAFYMKK